MSQTIAIREIIHLVSGTGLHWGATMGHGALSPNDIDTEDLWLNL